MHTRARMNLAMCDASAAVFRWRRCVWDWTLFGIHGFVKRGLTGLAVMPLRRLARLDIVGAAANPNPSTNTGARARAWCARAD